VTLGLYRRITFPSRSTRPGQHQQRPALVGDGFALIFVQPVEQAGRTGQPTRTADRLAVSTWTAPVELRSSS